MRKLETLLETVLKQDDGFQQSPVGIVFVEMRITAIALSNYFWHKNKKRNTTCQASGDSYTPLYNSNGKEEDSDVFADAENDDSMDFRVVSMKATTAASKPVVTGNSLVQCDVAVRKATHIFKYLSSKKSLNDHEQQELEDDWVHQTTQIRTIISKLRNRETNVLFATSIVEEVSAMISL
jgi:ERCC4-related helicase